MTPLATHHRRRDVPGRGELHDLRAARAPRPWWWWRRCRRHALRAAANACPMRAMARPSTACVAAISAAGRRRPTELLATTLCPPAPPATRSTARSGTSRPNAPALPVAETGRRRRAGDAAAHLLHAEPRHAGRRWPRRRAQPRDKPLLKLKLGGAGDAERMRAVRAARPDARLVADANEAWSAG